VDVARLRQSRDLGDGRRRTRNRKNRRRFRHIPKFARGRFDRIACGLIGQGNPCIVCDGWAWVGDWINASGQVQPIFTRPTKCGCGSIYTATMVAFEIVQRALPFVGT
jgi:hypothetical protein